MKKTKQLHHQLIEACKKNDAKAQLKLYNLYCKAMFATAVRYVKNQTLAEDVMQDAFIKAFRCIDDYRGNVPFGAWLKKILVHQCIDELKKRKLQWVTLDEEVHQPKNEEEAVWELEACVLAKKVVEIINSLQDKYRLVLTLFLLEGYDHQEISEILEIPVVTSRTHLLRGKKLVMQQLKSEENET